MSRHICFVCGSNGGESVLHIKPREKGSYFPFLEHHDPPKGAKTPSSDGTILSCRVCNSMLNGQWDSFERTKTPAIKRLYWLKRCDNGQFTGAEMRIQGEYAAQVMGLQYTPGSFGGASGGFADYATPLPSPTPSNFSSRQSSPKKPKYEHRTTVGDVLDLSVSSNPVGSKSNRSANQKTTSKSKKIDPVRELDIVHSKDNGTIVCFLCSSEQPSSLGRYIFSKKSVDGEPYFPFLERIRPPKGAMHLTTQGLTRVCSACRTTLSRQWKAYDGSNTPEHIRVYRINNEPVTLASRQDVVESPRKSVESYSGEDVMDFQEVCYLCGQVYHRDSMKLLYTKPPKENSKHSMYFPFVAKLQRHPKSKAIDTDGRVTSCRACYSYLQRQWQNYQSEGIPVKSREFVLRPLNSSGKDELQTKPERNSQENGEVNRPLNIQISSSGPMFSVPAPGLLAIASGLTPQMMMGMLPIHPAMYQQYHHLAAVAAQGIASQKPSSVDPKDTVETSEGNSTKSDNQTDSVEARKSDTESPAKHSRGVWCYVCGFKCTGDRSYNLNTFESKSNAEPFFPFLRIRDPAPRSEKMALDGTVKACRYCYYTLIYQWDVYERLQRVTNPKDRKYDVDEFVCFVCTKCNNRKNTRTVDLRYFPELVERNRPFGSLVMEEECSVAVCVKCEHRLAMQYSEFEEKKIAIGQRPYLIPESTTDTLKDHTSGAESNVSKHSSQTDGSSALEKQRPSSVPISHTTSQPVSLCKSSSSSPGLPTAGKPPPLNMVSPAAKIQRTTATVPPMNQVSPSSSITSVNSNNALSATRASSFAAALRKLAKQAGDPPDVGGLLRDSVREPSPVSTCPRTPTPKRAAPAPGVYSSGTSVINSPPVVTIAPTPSHSTTPTESRKSVDRAGAPSSSSTNAAMIEPLGIKTERDKMTASLGSGAGSSAGPGHDRRDEERPHSKDPSHPKPLSAHHMLNNSSAAAPPPGSSSGGSREEAPRGFQPYRPGEDMRHSLPPHFPLDAATAAAAYSAAAAYPAAFMQPHFTHPAFRFDDPLLLERYRMMQSPLMSGLPGYPPSMLHAQGISPLLHPGSRYPPELLAQHYPLMSPKLPDHRSPGASVDRKSEEEERREREGRERHEREERERERERREREEHERRERERQEKERQERERERLERERHERERQERERMERERIERERQLSLERLRAHDAERKSPARNDETGRFGGSITTGTPRDAIYADKYRNAMYPPPRDSLLSKPYSNLSAGVEERLTQSHLADKERGRQFMHEQVRHLYTEQYIRQQEALMREREQEKRDQERREKVTPPTKDDGRHARTSDPSGFHRPFADRPLTNGYEHNHFSDYERRIMTENILAQDRQILQDQQRPRSRPNSGHNGTNHSDSRTYDQVNERSYTEKQHEGMQARLIESEKSREHHAHIYHQRLNQYDYDRPHVEAQPVVASAFSHQNSFNSHSKDSNHLPRNDSRELRVPDPSNYFRFDGPVLSKLDLEEKKIKEARKNGMYDSDNSVSDSEDEAAKEERKKEKLLVISRGPPCKLDKSPKKLKYMHQFGLTTKEERKELDFERFSKRRKLYKESSVSPVKIGDENEMELSFRTDESLSPHPKTGHGFHPDQINREPDYSYKCSFLFKLGLQRVAPERRREMDIIRQVCMEDKRRRLGIKSESNDAFYNSHLPHYPNHILPDQINGLKRKYSELESGSLRPHRPEPQRITLGQLHERHLQTDHSSRPSLSQSSHLPHQQIAPLHQSADSRAVIYPESHDAKLRSREFAQEFHNEVLQATVKKEISKTQQGGSRNGSQSELRYNMDSLESTAYRGPTVSNNTAHSSNVIHSSKMSVTQDDSLSNTPASCKWPGIEAILESYQKHCEEQKMEQGILIEQCQRLQKTNSELHKTAETLSRRMADLMQGKSKSEDDRMNIQTAIDTLKKSLKFLR